MAVKKKVTATDREKWYQVTNDGILGAHQPETGEAAPHQFAVLKDVVSHKQLVDAGVDVAFQLKIGVLEPLGYVPILETTEETE